MRTTTEIFKGTSPCVQAPLCILRTNLLQEVQSRATNQEPLTIAKEYEKHDGLQ